MDKIILILTAVLCLTSIGQAVALFIQHSINRDYICVLWWLVGSSMQAVGYICLLFVQSTHFFGISMIAFPLILLGQLLHYNGIMKFLNKKVNRTICFLFYFCFLIIYNYFIFLEDSVVYRSVVVAFAIMIIMIVSIVQLFKNNEVMFKSSACFAGIVYSIQAVYLIIYIVSIVVLSNTYFYEIFSKSIIRMVAYIIPILASMLSVYAFIIMVNQRLNFENLKLVKRLEIEKKTAEVNAITDSLTGLMNRRFFDKVLKSEFKRSKRSNAPLSLIMLDVDYFKKFNDMYGHLEGDRCLVKLSESFNIIVSRTADIVARYGGEEFFVILPETDANGAYVVAKKIKNTVEELEIPHKASKAAKIVTISMGLVTIYAKDYKEIEDIIELADNALYRAKEKGRNQIVVSDESNRLQN